MQPTSTEITIADFLPKYPLIDKIHNKDAKKLIAYDSEQFEQSIYNKKEFYDNRLQPSESKPEKKGELMNHQKIIARYMSTVTPYDGLLLFHAMGSGKACVAVGAAERLRAQNIQSGKKIKGMIFLARGPNILNNIAKELVYVCTDGRYIPEDIDKIKPEMQMAKIKRSLLPFYGFYTIDKFLKSIKSLTQSQIRSRFSNYGFCIDEVHNLRTKDSSNKSIVSKDYHQIHKFLHQLQYKKVILLSGTPMADQPSEIADIMNLILPMDKQMPTGNDFDQEFLVQDPEMPLIYTINPDTKDDLKQYFKGRVSYLKSVQADVKVQYVGDKVGLLQYLDIYADDMIPDSIQNKSYLDAYARDTQRMQEPSLMTNPAQISTLSSTQLNIDDSLTLDPIQNIGGTTGLFHNSQQASIAVFPNGTYGSTGFKQYIKEVKSSLLLKAKGITQSEYVLNQKPLDADQKPIPSLATFLNTRDGPGSDKLTDIENRLSQLSKISTKFANVIRLLLERVNAKDKMKRGSSFVYCNWVTGSGCILFAKILELFGFKKAIGGEKKPDLRYALLTSAVATDNQISNLIETFNTPENTFGDVINVVIGSKIISEGISLKNIRDVHILSPHWNYTVTEQALSRAIRAFSHNPIQKELKQMITVSVYLHATVPVVTTIKDGDEEISYDIDQSIDIAMYEKSEHKDITIKHIEYVVKESAFDCALNYNRNYRGKRYQDGSRECDYGVCDYKCNGIVEPIDLDPTQLDMSTYRLYYQNDRVLYLIRAIKTIFRSEFIISFAQLKQQYGVDFTEFELLSALNKIVSSNIPVYNQYGFLSYCTVYNNFYFLTNSPQNIVKSTLSNFYTKYPPIHSSVTFNDIVASQSIENYPKLIRKLCTLPFSSDDSDTSVSHDSTSNTKPIENTARLSIFMKFPRDIQELFLEAAHQSSLRKDINPTSRMFAQWILKLLRWYILEIELSVTEKEQPKLTTISALLYTTATGNSRFRWFDKTTQQWNDATDYIAKQCNSIITRMLNYQQQTPFGWYGISGYDKFYLKNATKTDLHSKGQDCSTMDTWKLYYILLKLNTPRIVRPGDQEISIPSKTEMLAFLNPPDATPQTQFQKMMVDNTISSDVDKMLRGNKYLDGIKTIYWYSNQKKQIQKKRLCMDIKELLGRNNYIIGEYLTAKQTDKTKKDRQKKLSRNLKQRK